MSLKQKTVIGSIWSLIDSFANQGIQFIVGIILARILSPEEFGLIGMLTIFIALSQAFVDSGFSNALIRKQNCTQTDYSTVFYFNILTSVVLYLILFIFAGSISIFFNEPQLKPLIRILSIGIILNALGMIQRTILTKQINFKMQTRVSALSSSISGTIAIAMAINGFGVWSLVALTLFRFALSSILYWAWTNWYPILVFSKNSFKELFSFGNKLLLSGLLDTIYNNMYYLIIGKFFSAAKLGYFIRANQFQSLPSQQLTSILGRVSYPILSTIQDDTIKLKSAYQRLIKSTMFITSVLLLGMAASAESIIISLIGEQWRPSIAYLQMLCFVGLFYPISALNLNMLKVQGRSDLFLRLEIIKKVLSIPVIIIGIIYGIRIMILGMIINSIIGYYLNSFWSGKHIGYSFSQQLKDIIPSLLVATFMAIVILIIGNLISAEYHWILFLQIIIGAILTLLLAETFKLESYKDLKEIVFQQLG